MQLDIRLFHRDQGNKTTHKEETIMKYGLRGTIIFILQAGMAIGWLCQGVVQAQTFSPYSDFQAMTLQELDTLQVKLTYVGTRRSVFPSLAFTSPSNTFNLSDFTPFQRTEIDYFLDSIKVDTFTASSSELQAVIDNIGTLPNVTAGGVAASVYLSFALFNSQPGDKGFEAVLDKSDATALFDKLRLSLANNKDGLRKISDFACVTELLETTKPTDMSADVSVVFSGIRLNRETGLFVTTATITNNSGSTFQSPVSLVLDLGGNVSLVGEDGFTCGTSPIGREFINLSDTPGPGESTEITLEFDNPDLEQINVTTKVLAGPGAR